LECTYVCAGISTIDNLYAAQGLGVASFPEGLAVSLMQCPLLLRASAIARLFFAKGTVGSLTSTNFFVCSLWLLVPSLVEGAAVPLIQCPYYQYNGACFADLGRMTG